MPKYKSNKLPSFILVSLFAVSLLFEITGCGAVATSSATPTPNPTANPANVTLSTTAVDFGSVAVGSPKAASLTLTNNGGATANVSQITVTGTGFKLSSNIATPFPISAGQSITLNLTFTPGAAGAASGSISVTIDGVTAPLKASLTGNGLGANQLGVSPTSLTFGNVAVGSSSSQKGSLTAAGSGITVSSASWNGAGFSVSGINFPVTVAAGQSVPFTVTFAPQATGSATGSVSFFSNATNSPATEALSGSGTQTVATQHSVSLTWTASTSSVIGYNVYRGTQTGGPYTKITTSPQPGTAYSDSTVQSGATYFYVTTAVDASSQESTFSNESKAVVPTP